MSHTEETIFVERFHVPLWWWVLGAGAAAIIGATMHLGRGGVWSWFPYVGCAVAYALVAYLGMRHLRRQTITVTTDGQGGGHLNVGDARLPFDAISRGIVVPPTAKAAAMGRQLDPMAFVVHHGWCEWMVLVALDDPSDPTPYWLLSTEHPTELLDALPIHEWAEEQHD